jgi:hypothetical protein
MNPVLQMRRTEPAFLEGIIGNGAAATTRAIPTRKRYASAVGISHQRASRHRLGDAHSPSTKYLVQLAIADGGSAWPLISEGIAVVIQRSIHGQATESLHARLRELNDMEHTLESDENRATCNSTERATAEEMEAAADANVLEAELQLERAAILREIARRKPLV